jgi:N-acetyl-gamma-glutamylphosphate reductase
MSVSSSTPNSKAKRIFLTIKSTSYLILLFRYRHGHLKPYMTEDHPHIEPIEPIGGSLAQNSISPEITKVSAPAILGLCTQAPST